MNLGFSSQFWLCFSYILSEKFIWMQHTFYVNMKYKNLQYQNDRSLELIISSFRVGKICFSDTFPLNLLNIFEMWLPFFQIRSCPHLQENSSNRKVRKLSYPCLHTDSRRLCWDFSASGRLPSSALLGRSDKAAGWTDKTAGNEDQQGCSSCLPSMAGAW